MAEVSIQFTASGQDEIDHVIQSMRAVEQDLPNDFVQAIRDEAQVLRSLAQLRVVAEPIHGAKQTGLRAKMAAGTQTEDNSDGATVYVEPEGEDFRLPADMDEGAWSHPVFGHKDRPWVRQAGYFSWFMDTMDEGEDPLTQRMEEVLDHAIDTIAAA